MICLEQNRLMLLSISLIVFCATCPMFGQNYGTLRGLVSDSTNGEVLPYANVYIDELNTGASTDPNGFFIISSISSGSSYNVMISYMGYNSKEVEVFIEPNKITHVDLSLMPTSIEMQAIEKVAKKIIQKNETDIGLERITVKELEKLPHSGETDVIRAITFQPGVKTTSDISAKYYVRGGASNQNLVLFEGVTVYNPYHAMGLFSAFDSDIINSAEFHKGGFGADLGGRISSVLSLKTKDGNRNYYSATAGASSLTGKFVAEGPIPYGSFIVTGRKSYDNNIVKSYLENTPPISFYDASFKVNFSHPDFAPISKFTVFGLFTKDDIRQNDPGREDFNWANNIFGFKWLKAGEETPLFYEITLSYSQFKGELNPKLSNTRPRSNELSDMTLDMLFNYIYNSGDEIIVGLKYSDLRNKLSLENDVGYFYDKNQNGSNIVAFGKYKFLRYENFGMDAGVRVNLAGYSDKGGGFIEPRLSFTYRPFQNIALKGAWGIYQQELATLTNDDEIISVFEPWLIIPHYMEPIRGVDYSVGIDWDVLSGVSLKIGGYYKTISNLPEMNKNKIYSTDPDFISVEGESYGTETELNISVSPFHFRGAYTHSYSYNDNNGWVYYPNYDSRHSVNLSLEIDIGKGWIVGGMWNYNSGIPFTQTLGYYEKLFPDNLPDQEFIFDSYSPHLLLGLKNEGRLTPYHRLDVSVSKKMRLLFFDIDFNIGVLNVYDRKNIFYIDRETGEQVNSLPFLPTASLKIKL